MGILEQEGFESLQRKAKRYLRDVVNEIKNHITTEMERIMSELDRLNTAVDRELADDAAQNELIAELKRQLGEAQTAATAAQAGEAGANQRLTDALDAATSAAERLESNDPVVEPPADPPVEQPAEPPVEPTA